MKKTTKLAIGIAVAILCHSNFSLAQFQVGGPVGNRFGRTDNPGLNNTIRRVGIGDFPNGNPPSAAFEINSNLLTPVDLTAPNFFLQGEVFRTDCPAGFTAWRMLNGGITNGIISNLAGNNHFSLQANTGDMTFHTGGIVERMRINADGRAMIGTTTPFTSPGGTIISKLSVEADNDFIFYGRSQFSLNPSVAYQVNSLNALATFNFIVTDNTGNQTSAISWRNFNNATNSSNMDFFMRDAANGKEVRALTILNNANIGINEVAAPTEKLDVNGKIRIRELPNNSTLTNIVVADNNGVLHTSNAETLVSSTEAITKLQLQIQQLEAKVNELASLLASNSRE